MNKNQHKDIQEQVREFNALPAIVKLQMSGALKRENEEREKLKPIYDYFERGSTKIDEIMSIGDEYQVVRTITRRKGVEDEILYTGFIKYEEATRRYAYTLEECILETLAYRFDGPNSQFGRFAANALKIGYDEDRNDV